MANACAECRTRKLRCNRARPQCGTCQELGLACIINPTRQPRGPKKGHVKALKSRIESLERQLHESSESQGDTQSDGRSWKADRPMSGDASEDNFDEDNTMYMRESPDCFASDQAEEQSRALSEWQPTMAPLDASHTPVTTSSLDNEWNKHMEAILDPSKLPLLTAPPSTASFTYPLESGNGTGNGTCTGTGTTTETIDMAAQPITPPFFPSNLTVQMSNLERADLNDLFFDRVHVFAPIMNPQRYYARASQTSEVCEPFTCLQHATWTLASSMGSQFKHVQPILYTQTRAMLDIWERNVVDDAIPIELVQAWLLLAIYDIVKNNSQRGWISAGRCFRLVHLMKLHEIDNPEAWSASVHANLSQIEIEERRRTFWTAYALDRYANLVNGLPLTLTEQNILTRLPVPEAAFRSQRLVETEFLAPAITRKNDQPLSPFAKSVIMVTILGRCLSHKSQCNVERIMGSRSNEILARHISLDDDLNRVVQAISSTVSLDHEPCEPMSLFVEMLAQVSVLVLFAALKIVHEDSDTYREVYSRYGKRAEKAADRIHRLTQSLSNLGHFKVHPFTPIALHLCAIYAQPRKGRDTNSAAQFQAMSDALRDMSPANNLATRCLLELETGRRYETASTAMVS